MIKLNFSQAKWPMEPVLISGFCSRDLAFSNEDGNANDDGSEKSLIWFALYLLCEAR